MRWTEGAARGQDPCVGTAKVAYKVLRCADEKETAAVKAG